MFIIEQREGRKEGRKIRRQRVVSPFNSATKEVSSIKY
jgi:hypothetical protein